jgi:hypothetical protein
MNHYFKPGDSVLLPADYNTASASQPQPDCPASGVKD